MGNISLNQSNNSSRSQIVLYDNKLNDNSSLINIKRKIVNPYVYSRLWIEKNIYNFSLNNDISNINNFIYIGNYSTSTNKELLKENGITHIITALSDFNPPYPDDFKYCHIEAYDDLNENMTYKFPESNLFIKEAHDTGGKVYIHCMCGVSRSVTIALAYLLFLRQIKNDNLSEDEKLQLKLNENIDMTNDPLFQKLIDTNDVYKEIHQDITYELLLIKRKRPQANPNVSFLKQLDYYYS